MTELRRAAVACAAVGWAVLPLRGKVPLVEHGLHDASSDPKQVEQWWTRWPSANVGAVVPDGLLVLDVDAHHGGDDTLAALVTEHGPLPPTLTSLTGGGGAHLFFRAPVGRLRGQLGPGIDLRLAGRHYVVLPPSVHASGKSYAWDDPEVAPAALPARLAALVRAPVARPRTTVVSTAGDKYAAVALEREAATVARPVEGTRNHVLNTASFNVGQLVAIGALDESHVTDTLLAAAGACGLSQVEAERTIASGLRAGMAAPRRRTA